MNARSLVGMTMGARKRAARRSLYPRVGLTKPKAKRVQLWCFRSATTGSRLFTTDGYAAACSTYRIGQRLRPCLGCLRPPRRWRRYACGTCGACGVALWRPYGEFFRPERLRCTDCAPPIDPETGRPPWHVPLIIGKKGTIWGFRARACVAGMKRWRMLSARVERPCRTCDGSGVLPARGP